MNINNQYYTVNEEYGERFFQVPKVFFTNPLYKDGLNAMEKIAFGMLKDRFSLSVKNGWYDEQGRIYFIYTRDKLAEILDCSLPTVTKVRKSLVKVGLLEIKRQGQGKPDLLYLKKPIVDSNDIYEINKSESLDTQERLKNLTSSSEESLLQDVKNFAPNDTDLKDTDLREFEEEDIYTPAQKNKNTSLQILSKTLKEKGLSERMTNNILDEARKQDLYEFSLIDAMKQIEHMTNEYNNGVVYGQYHTYYINGLISRTEQRRLSDIDRWYKEIEEQIKMKRDTSVYFDWVAGE